MQRTLLGPFFVDVIAKLFNSLRDLKGLRWGMPAPPISTPEGRQTPALAEIPSNAARCRVSMCEGRSLNGRSGSRKYPTISSILRYC